MNGPSASTAAPPPALADAVRAGLRQLASGVCIIATGAGDGRRGLTATAVCGLTIEPPTLIVCVNREADAHPVIRAEGRFAVNVLAAGQQDLADRFAARDGSKGAGRFAHARWTTLATGAPVLEDALANFDCTVIDAVEMGSHTVFFGRVAAARTAAAGAALIYHDGAYGLAAPLDSGRG